MKVMVLVKATEDSEAGVMPGEALLTAMGKYNEELVDAGIMVDGDGLRPSSSAVKINFSGESRSVVDGPFTETKELIAGYWVWNVESMDHAIQWAKKCPGDHGQLEIRPFVQPEDFGEAFTPELREKEEELRRRTEKNK